MFTYTNSRTTLTIDEDDNLTTAKLDAPSPTFNGRK